MTRRTDPETEDAAARIAWDELWRVLLTPRSDLSADIQRLEARGVLAPDFEQRTLAA